MKDFKGWHHRGYLPHYDQAGETQSVTFRLADSYPIELMEKAKLMLQQEKRNGKSLATAYRKQCERILDHGHGACYLENPKVGSAVQQSMLHFAGERYMLHAWVVMPNHVHALLTPIEGFTLGSILHSWQSYTAIQANRILYRKGRFWAKGNWDRYIRDETHFWNAFHYFENNPVQAGLCQFPEEWPFGSAAFRRCYTDGNGSRG